jgi:hypothetical protein
MGESENQGTISLSTTSLTLCHEADTRVGCFVGEEGMMLMWWSGNQSGMSGR